MKYLVIKHVADNRTTYTIYATTLLKIRKKKNDISQADTVRTIIFVFDKNGIITEVKNISRHIYFYIAMYEMSAVVDTLSEAKQTIIKDLL